MQSNAPQATPVNFCLDDRQRGFGLTVRIEVVMLAIDNAKLRLLMIERDCEPYRNGWALPGQYLWEDASPEIMAHMIPGLLGIETSTPQMFAVFGEPKRDRRCRDIAIAYLCAANLTQMTDLTHRDSRFRIVTFEPGSGHGTNLMWKGDPVIDVAFDHAGIIRHAFMNMQDRLDHSMIGFDFLPERFTIYELQRVHEILLCRKLDKILFRKRMLKRTFANGCRLERCDERRATTGRPAALYRLVRHSPNLKSAAPGPASPRNTGAGRKARPS